MTRFIGIDPATRTGFVVLDEHGNVLVAKELQGIGNEDPKRLSTLLDEITHHVDLYRGVVAIEGFPFATQRAMFAGGLHWGLRIWMWRWGIPYTDIAPNALKAHIGVTGWKGEKGKKVRLKDKEKKQAVAEAVKRIYGYEHPNDNIVDAYVLARIALENWKKENEHVHSI